jgi:DNA-binding NarL/FixJ family response regulator
MPAMNSTRPTGTKKKRVLLVDDHPMLRKGVAELINGENALEVCGEAGTMGDAFSEVGKLKPDVVVIDVSLDGNNGIELMKQLAFKYPTLPMLAYSMHDEQIYAERVLRAGAKGYVMKQSSPEMYF